MRLKQRSWLVAAVLVCALAAFRACLANRRFARGPGRHERAGKVAGPTASAPRRHRKSCHAFCRSCVHETTAVREAAFNVLADIANEASAPGHEADRAAVTARLMSLLEPSQPAQIKIRGLRLLPIVIPPNGDVGPVAALLSDTELRERAREALEETGTAASRTVLREHLAHADPEFACALLNSLGRLHDREGLELICDADGGSQPQGPSRGGPRTGLDGRPCVSHDGSTSCRCFGPGHSAGRGGRGAPSALLFGRPAAHRGAAIAGYRFLLETKVDGQVKDGALAGLGRVGDASCVPLILGAIRDAQPPTLLVGMNAFGALPGKDVTQSLIRAYPTLPEVAQSALIPILGARHDALVLPLLEQLSRSDRADTRLAALQALGETDLPEAIKLLSALEDARRSSFSGEDSRHDRRAQSPRNGDAPT